MATLYFVGKIEATPTAATILIEGAEVYSGQIGTGQPLDTQINLAEIDSDGGAVSISVTSGVAKIGPVWYNLTGNAGNVILSDDMRSSILINGQAPEWPATPVDPMPRGSEGSPDWTGWHFEIGAGETITFTVNLPS